MGPDYGLACKILISLIASVSTTVSATVSLKVSNSNSLLRVCQGIGCSYYLCTCSKFVKFKTCITPTFRVAQMPYQHTHLGHLYTTYKQKSLHDHHLFFFRAMVGGITFCQFGNLQPPFQATMQTGSNKLLSLYKAKRCHNFNVCIWEENRIIFLTLHFVLFRL